MGETKSVSQCQPSPTFCYDSQKPRNDQSTSFFFLTYQNVMAELEKLIQESKPSLNGEVLHQEGIRLYHQIEANIPYNHYQRVGIPSELIRSLVLHALRQFCNYLGVQNPNDELISEWLTYSQNLNKKSRMPDYHKLQLHPLKLSKGVVSAIFFPFRYKSKIRR